MAFADRTRRSTMLSQECIQEFRASWLPNLTDAGLSRLIELLEQGSPLLIHGCFTKAVPMGCLASHAGWNHPQTAHLTLDAGITWLNQVAGLNPATSHVIREWDGRGAHGWEVRAEFLSHLKEERKRRQLPPAPPRRPHAQPAPSASEEEACLLASVAG
jgi:hypothetical protein